MKDLSWIPFSKLSASLQWEGLHFQVLRRPGRSRHREQVAPDDGGRMWTAAAQTDGGSTTPRQSSDGAMWVQGPEGDMPYTAREEPTEAPMRESLSHLPGPKITDQGLLCPLSHSPPHPPCCSGRGQEKSLVSQEEDSRSSSHYSTTEALRAEGRLLLGFYYYQ